MCAGQGRDKYQCRHPTDKCFIYKIDQRAMIVKLSKEERQEKMSKNRQSPNPNKTERERKNHFSKLYQNKKTKTLRTNKNDKERTKSRGVLTFRVLPSMYLPLQDLIVTVFYTLIFLHPLSLQRPHSK